MKKILVAIVVLVLLLLVLPVSNLVVGLPETALASVSTEDPHLSAAVDVLAAKCGSCHTPSPALPWYASLPVANDLMARDVRDGVVAMDFLAALTPGDGPVDEVVLAKTEHVVRTGAMPPGRFVALHWNKGLGDDEAKAVLEWVADVRAKHYATGTAAEAHADLPIQPLPEAVEFDAAKAELGRELYFDKRLSGDGTLNCASCHSLDKGGCDQAPVATGIDGQKGPINSPTVLNSRYNLAQFWDGRAADLQAQAAGPVANPIEMGATWPDVVAKLSADADFVARFTAVYPEGVSEATVTNAIAEYEKTLVTPNDALDRYLKGDDAALTDEAKAGLALFLDTGCATCHVGKALGGRSYEVMGRRAAYFADPAKTTAVDRGRYNVTKRSEDFHRFKVPLLRNVAETHPYFHDASAPDLATAVRTMARVQHGVDLTDAQVTELVAFLESLTGELKHR